MAMDKGKTGHISGKFLGDTKGNMDLKTNRTDGESNGGAGESHMKKGTDKYCGPTKGNTDLPIDRTAGVVTGKGGGQHKAGGDGKMGQY